MGSAHVNVGRGRAHRAARSLSLLVLAAAALACGPVAQAWGANLFTLDPQADSIGPVVVDKSGNGYVAWLHKSSPADTVMFCKFAPGARRCAHPLKLSVTLLEAGSVTDTPFAVLGPGSTVFVVAPSYDTNQMVIWESSDRGVSFGPAWVATAGNEQTSVCRVGTNLDDVVPFNAYGGQYDPSQGLTTLGASSSNLELEMSSANPSVSWTFAFYGQGCVEPDSATEHSGPGEIPFQYFAFGGGSGAESSLGWAGGGSAACSSVAPGDEVEAYADASTTPSTVRFYRWSAPTGPCAITGKNLGPSGAANWAGASTVIPGAFPRLAGGAAGLFMLSGDAVKSGASQPTAVDVRPYHLSTHSFGAPRRLAVVADEDFETGGPAGGLGENYTTGELAAVWPDVGGETGMMSLFISTDGGARFSAAQDIAQIGSGYSILDNARVAVAANGTGFVTYQDDGGLHVADLNPLTTPYKRLVAHHHTTLEIPVTCEAPKGACKASASVKVQGHTIARGQRTVHSGLTAILRLVLDANGQALLANAKGHLGATLKLTITHPGASAERLVLPTVLAS
jgi:hypothetical protein